ncbi:hypothetical protein AGOR_G00097770 [Albula goreensis]|uniref:Uncharacterized protein n=1 Tax=Albula goreensis TaxID=1534307 RepID=A0A8T3DL03_9TELE|nr:hypothetical protein AGOR_G00097770 [Albula goreensis]
MSNKTNFIKVDAAVSETSLNAGADSSEMDLQPFLRLHSWLHEDGALTREEKKIPWEAVEGKKVSPVGASRVDGISVGSDLPAQRCSGWIKLQLEART